jgi:FKBP-type peptidyl-prolyl cis-trans isomerase (trigger factor)
MKTILKDFQQLKDKTFVLSLTLSNDNIANTYQEVLKSAQSDFENKGFRKGKVPLEIVKSGLSENKIIEEVLTQIVSKTYSQKVQEHHLHPVIQPQIKIQNPPLTFDKDWLIEITGCELPETTLDPKYTEEIKKINQTKDDDNKKINTTIGVLIKHSQVDIPEILIKADLENKLSQLVDQTQQAGLTVSQYLKSKNQTLEQYQQDLKLSIRNEWVTNLAIDHIAKENKIEVSQKEVDDLISKNKQLSQNLNLVYYLLTQQKVFDYLKKL